MAFSLDLDVPKEYRSYLPAFMDHSEPTYKKNVPNV